MSEQARISYLEQLGIDSFVPRVTLAYAPESYQCIFYELSESHAVERSPTDNENTASVASEKTAVIIGVDDPDTAGLMADSRPQRAETVVGDLMDRLNREPVSRSAASPTEVAPEAKKLAPVERPTFSLSIWRASAPLLIIDSHRQGAALPTERLLHNMLRHSRWRSPQLQPCQYQHWPMQGVSEEHSGWQGAKDMFDSFFEGIFATGSVDCVWLLGDKAYRAANGESEDDERPFSVLCFTEVILSKNSVRALVLPSLADILEQPSVKKKIWPLI